jgi:hypothetical protein
MPPHGQPANRKRTRGCQRRSLQVPKVGVTEPVLSAGVRSKTVRFANYSKGRPEFFSNRQDAQPSLPVGTDPNNGTVAGGVGDQRCRPHSNLLY